MKISDYTKGIVATCIASVFAVAITGWATFYSEVGANSEFREYFKPHIEEVRLNTEFRKEIKPMFTEVRDGQLKMQQQMEELLRRIEKMDK